MRYLSVHVQWLHRPPAAGASSVALGAWARVASYAAEMELGVLGERATQHKPLGRARLIGCRAWGNTEWQGLCRVDRKSVELLVQEKLATWDGNDLLIEGYDLWGEREYARKREFGQLPRVQHNGLPFCTLGSNGEPPVCDRGPVTIYALVDPRDNTVRYVGKTSDPSARLAQHIENTAGKGHKNVWVRDLKASGLRPTMEILERVPVAEWEAAERRWIAFYSTRGSVLNVEIGGAH